MIPGCLQMWQLVKTLWPNIPIPASKFASRIRHSYETLLLTLTLKSHLHSAEPFHKSLISFLRRYFPTMSLTGILFVAFTTCQIISAAPNCDRSSLATCLLPFMSYVMGPEAEDLAAVADSMNYTDKQFGDFCRIGISFFDCYRDYFMRCVVGMSDAQQFAAKAAQLVRRCDNPTFGSDARTLFQCYNVLNRTKAKTVACSNAARRWFREDLRSLTPSLSGGRWDSNGWNSGSMVDSLCCNTKYYRQCSGSEVNDKCGQQAQQVFNSLHDAMMSTFECNTRTNNCRTRPDPSPEDYTSKVDMEFMSSLFSDNTGLQTGVQTYTPMRFKTSSSNLVHASNTIISIGLVLLAKTLFIGH